MNIIILDNHENILDFLNPDLIDISETYQNGLRSIDVEYNIEDFLDAKKLFKQGHKIFIIGDRNLTDCLYVLNTQIKQDLFEKNQFSFSADEVLVELNYAPFFTQDQLSSNKAFTVGNREGEKTVTVNYNSLNAWFGEYFNIGIVQDCMSDYVSKITFSGSMSLMSLLRYIETETGNVFVTRYEKDVISNTIHRYLDFLNPVSQNKNWSTFFEYDFLGESQTYFIDEELDYDEDDFLEVQLQKNPLIQDFNPENTEFRITYNNEIVVTDSNIPLCWNAKDVGVSNTLKQIAIEIRYGDKGENKVAIKIHKKSFTYVEENIGCNAPEHLESINDDPNFIDDNVIIPDNACFEFYDTVNDRVIYSRILNPILSKTRPEILDLGYTVENISFDIDESDTFSAISPVLSVKKGDATNSLSSEEMEKVITRWKNLKVTKNDIIPMIVEKQTITGTESHPCSQRKGTATSPKKSAEQILGPYSVNSNYYSRPLKPNDNVEGDNKSYEYWRGTAYWRAPFNKRKGSFHIELNTNNGIEYQQICNRRDKRGDRSFNNTPKMGQVETSNEDIYSIYNDVAMKLKDKMSPKFTVTVDVANYKDGLFNNYDIHDKVYVKLPASNELITAKVVKTVKDLHDLSKNKIVLDNYNITTKETTIDTYIDASNITFKYPKSKKLTVTLHDVNDDSKKLKNKVINFQLYAIENNSSSFTGKAYAKKTNSKGQATINCKYDPGKYEMKISFAGDAEYTECDFTVNITVTGVKKERKVDTNKNKPTTSVKYKTQKRFWTKCGLSPDKNHKEVVSISQPSTSDAYKYDYSTLWKTVFKNRCPNCGRTGTLRFDGLQYNKCITSSTYGVDYKPSVPEHEITCISCDSDYCGVTGLEKSYGHVSRLTTIKKPVRSSRSEFYQLCKGKLLYDTQKVKVKVTRTSKTNKSKVSYNNHAPGIPKMVKQKAIQLAKGGNDINALKRIADFMGSSIGYSSYPDFERGSISVLSNRSGNCCDQTRLMLQMMDVVDSENKFTFYYVHVCCSSSNMGHVFAKVVTKKSGNWRYVDPCKTAGPWGNYVTGWGSPPGNQYKTNNNNLLYGIFG